MSMSRGQRKRAHHRLAAPGALDMTNVDALPVFVFEKAAVEALDAAELHAYDARYVVAPFPKFSLATTSPALVTTDGCEQKVPLLRIMVEDLGEGRLRIVETLRSAEGWLFAADLLLDVDAARIQLEGGVFVDGLREPPTRTWVDLSQPTDAARTGRIVVGLLLAINHREIVIEETAPTRQQRRAAERKGERPEAYHFVRITGDIVRHAKEVGRGMQARKRARHLVRSHVRHLRDGRTTKVRAHARGQGEIKSLPVYDATRIALN